ncbi:hypothetical protein [Latilactobacillus sakei]|nr:hypothetical protein [Latilactobacillus sakei]
MLEVVNANLLAGTALRVSYQYSKFRAQPTMIIYIGSQVELNAAGI